MTNKYQAHMFYWKLNINFNHKLLYALVYNDFNFRD